MPNPMFVHAIGRSGADAWPLQSGLRHARFLTRRGFGGDELRPHYGVDDEGRWIAARSDSDTVLVGHSWAAVAVLSGLLRGGAPARAAVLIEPPATFAAADATAVREHVTAMDAAYEPGLDLDAFRTRFNRGMGIEMSAPTSAGQRRALERLRRHRPPWETELTVDDLTTMPVPVVVVTGGWSPMYEVIAEALATAPNAEWRALQGSGHRPQDDVRFNDLLAHWL